MSKIITLIVYLLWVRMVPAATDAAWHGDDAVAASFRVPPDAVRPEVIWHWMNGNISKEGITLDLEAMQRVGIRGAYIYNVAPSIPGGPVKFMTPAWREMTRFAFQEAQRLHMSLGVHNCAGWSSSGGPWVPVEDSMMELTWNETVVAGGAVFDGSLAQPFTRKGFYRDVAPVAVPLGAAEAVRMRDLAAKATTSLPGGDADVVVDGDFATRLRGPPPSASEPVTITIALREPMLAQTLSITPGPAFGSCSGYLESSLDGASFQRICPFLIPEMGNAQTYLTQGFAPVTARYFRLVFNKSDVRNNPLDIAEIELSPEFKLTDWRAKAGFICQPALREDSRPLAADQAKPKNAIVDLTSRFEANGHLRWEAPPGRWKLMRFGYTTRDKFNKPGPPEAVGLECDKMSRPALNAFWDGMMRTLLRDNPDLVGKSFRSVMLDSFEVGAQNYTPALADEFVRRCGYSLHPFLPALTGTIVESIDVTERFLWDYRRVLADLWKENYFDYLDVLAKRSGLEFIMQPYGNGNFDAVSAGSGGGHPMTEFWIDPNRNPLRQMNVSSSAHLANNSVVYAESFTAHPEYGGWRNSPASMKKIGDQAFCDGVNGIAFHTYAHQPWVEAKPGMTMGPYGIHFNRGNTWWEYVGPWMDYIARCQLLLRRGHTVVDIAVFAGENSPVSGGLMPKLDGYRSDFIDRIGLEKLTVENGELALPSGIRYRLLLIPPEPRGLSLRVLRAVQRLVRDGATVVGPKPERTPSLEGFPGSEQQAREIADLVWGAGAPAMHVYGRGRVLSSTVVTDSAAQLLAHELAVPPDCAVAEPVPTGTFAFIQRQEEAAHYYFVSNQTDQPFRHDLRFRVTGMQPEFWNPLNGEIRPATDFVIDRQTTAVSVELPPSGSVFVVFRAPLPTAAHSPRKPAERAVAQVPPPFVVPDEWRLTFAERKGQPTQTILLNHLISWSEDARDFVRYFSGTAEYETDFILPAKLADVAGLEADLDLGRVEVLAQVELNGHPCGTLWTSPFACRVTDALAPGRNCLRIRVVNLWPNRLIGDQHRGDPRKWNERGAPLEWPAELVPAQAPAPGGLNWMSWRHFTKDAPLLPSGLLGPVRIVFSGDTQKRSP